MGPLDAYVIDLLAAKDIEEKARLVRIGVEEKIAALIPGPESGQRTIKLDDGTSVTVKRGWNYSADVDSLRSFMLDQFPNDPLPVKSQTTHKLDEKGYEWYKDSCPAIYGLISQYVQVTPKKVSVEIKQK